MSDAFDETLEGDEVAAAGTSKKKPILLLLVVAAAGGAYFFMRGGEADAGTEASHTEGAVATKEATVELDPFVVNLNEPGELRYLKCRVALELRGEKAKADVAALDKRLRHTALLYLSSLRLAETFGVENKERIQEGLLERFRSILGETSIEALYLTEFVIQ